MDLAMLDAARDTATDLIEQHERTRLLTPYDEADYGTYGNDPTTTPTLTTTREVHARGIVSKPKDWSVENAPYFSENGIPCDPTEINRRTSRLLAATSQLGTLGLKEGVLEATELFLLTEDGITYYPRDVGNILNPGGDTSDDNNPYEVFSRYWSGEEFNHTDSGKFQARLMGIDQVRLEARRMAFIRSGLVPRFVNSAVGLAFTSIQESNTRVPYTELAGEYAEGEKKAITMGLEEAASIMGIGKYIYTRTAYDENLHRRFLSGIVNTALHCGDPKIASHMLRGIEEIVFDFYMPGVEGIPGFADDAKKIAKAGIFTHNDSHQSRLDLLRFWRVQDLTNLTGAGNAAQERLGKYVTRTTALLAKSAARAQAKNTQS